MKRELIELIAEIRQKTGLSDPIKMRNLRFEMLLLEVYGRIPTVEDAKFTSEGTLNVDWNDLRVTVVYVPRTTSRRTTRVWARQLNADIFVFAREDPDTELLGWISGEQIEEAPIEWDESYGKRIDFCHTVHHDALLPIQRSGEPFHSRCSHGAGYWEYHHRAWRCFGCDSLRYVAADVDLIERHNEELFRSASSETSSPESGSQREKGESGVRAEPELREQGRMWGD